MNNIKFSSRLHKTEQKFAVISDGDAIHAHVKHVCTNQSVVTLHRRVLSFDYNENNADVSDDNNDNTPNTSNNLSFRFLEVK